MANQPRQHAFAILRTFNPRKDTLDQALNAVRANVDNVTAGVVTGMCEDALRHAAIIDHMVAQVSTMPPSKMEHRVLAALRVGLTSFVRGDPVHAAVSETVNLLKNQAPARKLVNAVMRRITETLKIRDLSPEEALELRQSPAQSKLVSARSMPWGDRFLLETEFDYFPAEETERLQLLANFSPELWGRLARTLLPEELAQVAIAASISPRVWFRMRDGRQDQVNKVLAGMDEVRRIDEDASDRFDGTSSAQVEIRGLSIGVNERVAFKLIHSHPFRTGGLTVQDYAAQLPARGLSPDEGDAIIDFCAAPGGKTLQLADAVGEQGRVVAFDQNEKKLKRIKQNLQRWGFANTSGAFGDARVVELPDCGRFDAVLVDAPCSNTGVMGRRLESRLRFDVKELAELKEIQGAILANAARHIRKGGKVCYSTCSLLDEENGAMVRAFLDTKGGEKSGWRLLDEQLTLPTPGGHDGGYFAILLAP